MRFQEEHSHKDLAEKVRCRECGKREDGARNFPSSQTTALTDLSVERVDFLDLVIGEGGKALKQRREILAHVGVRSIPGNKVMMSSTRGTERQGRSQQRQTSEKEGNEDADR